MTDKNGNGETRKSVASLAKEVIRQKEDIAILKNELTNQNALHNRLDIAIDKLTNISTNLKSMIAVHEEKLNQSERVDDILFKKLNDSTSKIESMIVDVRNEMNMIEKTINLEIKSLKNDFNNRVGGLEKYKWVILGGAIVIGWVLSKNLMPILKMMSASAF